MRKVEIDKIEKLQKNIKLLFLVRKKNKLKLRKFTQYIHKLWQQV